MHNYLSHRFLSNVSIPSRGWMNCITSSHWPSRISCLLKAANGQFSRHLQIHFTITVLLFCVSKHRVSPNMNLVCFFKKQQKCTLEAWESYKTHTPTNTHTWGRACHPSTVHWWHRSPSPRPACWCAASWSWGNPASAWSPPPPWCWSSPPPSWSQTRGGSSQPAGTYNRERER